MPGGGGSDEPCGGGGKGDALPPGGNDARASSGLALMGGRDVVAGGGGKGELTPRSVDFPAIAIGGGVSSCPGSKRESARSGWTTEAMVRSTSERWPRGRTPSHSARRASDAKTAATVALGSRRTRALRAA